MLQQPLAEVDQGRGMKDLVADVAVEREVPARVIAEQLDGLPIRNRLQVLQKAHSQEQHRLDRFATVLGTVTLFQLSPSARQSGIDLRREQPITILLRKEGAGQPGRGKKFGLSGEVGQTHVKTRL